jgi:triphosphatase
MEIEAKYRLTAPVTAEQVEAMDWTPYQLGPRSSVDQLDTFFDTSDRAISRTIHAVRLREGGAQPVVTLKGPATIEAGIHSREEIELPTEERAPDGWPAPIRERLQQLIGAQSIQPLLEVQNGRRTWPLLKDGAVIGEVALDEGEVRAGERREPMHEIEIELKGGERSDLERVGALVLRQLPATPEDRSKFQRGFALLPPLTAVDRR